MKSKQKIIFSYIFIVLFSFFVLTFQINTLSIINKNVLSQDYGIDGFVDEDGKKKDPLDIGPSNEEVYKFIKKYLPTAGTILVAGLIIIIIYQRTQLKKVEKPGLIKIENNNGMIESDIYQLIPHYDKEKFINARYNDFVESLSNQ